MIKGLLKGITFLLIFQTVTAQDNSKPATKNLSIFFVAEKKYLVLPVKNSAAKRNIELWIDGVNRRFLDMELAEAQPDWNAYLNIEEWKGKELELRVDKVPVDSKVFSPIKQSDLDTNANIPYKEKLRGQFHFSPKRGWTNDPNGMVYYNGEYHLFFQHNPYGLNWGNMTWGHAVSKDLVHWKELDDAIHPNQFGPIFSGGGVVDEKNTSGLGTADKPALVVFYTGARAWAQCLAWSLDGRSFQTLDRAVVTRINKDNRDPKVIWHEPTKKWVMVVYVERDGGLHSMQFLTSPDLLNWTKTSIINGGTGNDRYLFECPEFYELPVVGTTEKKWVLTGANSEYAIGSFDGSTFTPEAERLNGQFGRDFYAAQTFSNEPTGRRIEIGWWRTHTGKDGMTFNQSMSIPMEHKLVQTPAGIRLTRMPVKELETLRMNTFDLGKKTLKENGINPLKEMNLELLELHLQIEAGKAKEIVLDIRGVPVTYHVAKEELIVDGVKAPADLQNGTLNLIVYADRTGLEIFANDGLLYMPININLPENNRSLSLSVKGGPAKISGLKVYKLKSVWDSGL